MESKANLQALLGLGSFYRGGLGELQLVDNGRNRIGDGKGEARTRGGLTNFGISVVKEMNGLGMLIDVAHLTEPGFWDVIETSKGPIIDSHSNCRGVYDHTPNITDEQIKAIAQKGGVIGLSCNSAMVSKDKDIIGLVGIDHVGLGPDHAEFEIKYYNIWRETGSGCMEGVFFGHRDPSYIVGFDSIAGFPLFTGALVWYVPLPSSGRCLNPGCLHPLEA